ncbi:hypothetical protein DFH09DRAFT_1447705 [Mycena vulgaris]|nr:hypothetical protein DFH09DRAFT_1447705 [Mycena vulgaris]
MPAGSHAGSAGEPEGTIIEHRTEFPPLRDYHQPISAVLNQYESPRLETIDLRTLLPRWKIHCHATVMERRNEQSRSHHHEKCNSQASPIELNLLDTPLTKVETNEGIDTSEVKSGLIKVVYRLGIENYQLLLTYLYHRRVVANNSFTAMGQNPPKSPTFGLNRMNSYSLANRSIATAYCRSHHQEPPVAFAQHIPHPLPAGQFAYLFGSHPNPEHPPARDGLVGSTVREDAQFLVAETTAQSHDSLRSDLEQEHEVSHRDAHADQGTSTTIIGRQTEDSFPPLIDCHMPIRAVIHEGPNELKINIPTLLPRHRVFRKSTICNRQDDCIVKAVAFGKKGLSNLRTATRRLQRDVFIMELDLLNRLLTTVQSTEADVAAGSIRSVYRLRSDDHRSLLAHLSYRMEIARDAFTLLGRSQPKLPVFGLAAESSQINPTLAYHGLLSKSPPFPSRPTRKRLPEPPQAAAHGHVLSGRRLSSNGTDPAAKTASAKPRPPFQLTHSGSAPAMHSHRPVVQPFPDLPPARYREIAFSASSTAVPNPDHDEAHVIQHSRTCLLRNQFGYWSTIQAERSVRYKSVEIEWWNPVRRRFVVTVQIGPQVIGRRADRDTVGVGRTSGALPGAKSERLSRSTGFTFPTNPRGARVDIALADYCRWGISQDRSKLSGHRGRLNFTGEFRARKQAGKNASENGMQLAILVAADCELAELARGADREGGGAARFPASRMERDGHSRSRRARFGGQILSSVDGRSKQFKQKAERALLTCEIHIGGLGGREGTYPCGKRPMLSDACGTGWQATEILFQNTRQNQGGGAFNYGVGESRVQKLGAKAEAGGGGRGYQMGLDDSPTVKPAAEENERSAGCHVTARLLLIRELESGGGVRGATATSSGKDRAFPLLNVERPNARGETTSLCIVYIAYDASLPHASPHLRKSTTAIPPPPRNLQSSKRASAEQRLQNPRLKMNALSPGFKSNLDRWADQSTGLNQRLNERIKQQDRAVLGPRRQTRRSGSRVARATATRVTAEPVDRMRLEAGALANLGLGVETRTPKERRMKEPEELVRRKSLSEGVAREPRTWDIVSSASILSISSARFGRYECGDGVEFEGRGIQSSTTQYSGLGWAFAGRNWAQGVGERGSTSTRFLASEMTSGKTRDEGCYGQYRQGGGEKTCGSYIELESHDIRHLSLESHRMPLVT